MISWKFNNSTISRTFAFLFLFFGFVEDHYVNYRVTGNNIFLPQ